MVAMRVLALVLCVALVSAGCTTERYVTGPAFRYQAGRPPRDQMLLTAIDNWTTRVDPNSRVRFFLRGGEVTEPVPARDLWASDLGLSYAHGDRMVFLEWEEVNHLEVSNLSGIKTFAVMVLVAGVIVLLVASLKGGGGGGGGGADAFRLMGGATQPGGRTRAGVALAAGQLAPRRVFLYRDGTPHIHVPLMVALQYQGAGYVSSVPPLPPPPPPPPGCSAAEQAGAAPERRATCTEDSTPRSLVRRKAEPFFSDSARRRSWIMFGATADGGTDFSRTDGGTGSVVAALRLGRAFEIGGGVRLFSMQVSEGYADAGRTAWSFVGLGRLGVHLDLDANRRFAIPVSIEAGAGRGADFHGRLNIGLRVRVWRDLTVGLLPFNPTLVYFSKDSLLEGARRWRFPTTLEVGVSL
jgi:hypothetical protein